MNLKVKYPLLVNCEWLQKNYSKSHLRVFDCTVWLKPQPDKIYEIYSGKPDYDREHIPNSDFLNVLDLSDKKSPYDFMMPSTKVFNKIMSSKGIGPDTHVVLYSRKNMQWATRVWWMLKSVNFSNVSILNGGFDRWKLEKRITTSDSIRYKPNNFKSKHLQGFFCDKAEILENINKQDVCIINALRKTLHDATENINYGRPGHIKNSINIPSADMLNNNNFLYKEIGNLKKIFNKYNVLNKKKVITYCGGGIAATNIAFALTVLGYNNISVYDASLNEWAKDKKLPLEI